MDMHAAQHVAPAEHLQPFHHLIVPLPRGLYRFAPFTQWMCTARKYPESPIAGRASGRLSQSLQFFSRIGQVRVRPGADLELSLQHLAPQRGAIRISEERFRSFHGGSQRFRATYEVLLLDAETKLFGGGG